MAQPSPMSGEARATSSTSARSSEPPLFGLPNEILSQCFRYLSPLGLACVSQTCRRLKECAQDDDLLWKGIVLRNIRGIKPASLPPGVSSWRQFYLSKHPFWFLSRYAVWFSDAPHHGKLILARYDYRIDAIEAYTLTAEKPTAPGVFWQHNMDVMIQPFNPNVRLDLNRPVLKLDKNAFVAPLPRPSHLEDYGERASDDTSPPSPAYEQALAGGFLIDHEVVMGIQDDRIFNQLVPAKHLPAAAIGHQTSVWPPPAIPSPSRVLNQTSTHFQSQGFRPTAHRELSQHAFRLRRFPALRHLTGTRATDLANYTPPTLPPSTGGAHVLSRFASIGALGAILGHGRHGRGGTTVGGMPLGEDQMVHTFATLDPALYTPTPRRPWRGIWAGDYAGHGVEFVVVLQPEDPDAAPLPPHVAAPYAASERFRAAAQARVDDDDDAAASDEGERSHRSHRDGSPSPPPQDGAAAADPEPLRPLYQGRLEAVKLTGDPNIPRGEYTFIAPDIGDGGLIRIATEDIFRGARVVRSVGHIASPFFRDDNYVPSQLILISENRIAQYWEAFGHISFFERVDIERFLDVDLDSEHSRSRSTPAPSTQ